MARTITRGELVGRHMRAFASIELQLVDACLSLQLTPERDPPDSTVSLVSPSRDRYRIPSLDQNLMACASDSGCGADL